MIVKISNKYKEIILSMKHFRRLIKYTPEATAEILKIIAENKTKVIFTFWIKFFRFLLK